MNEGNQLGVPRTELHLQMNETRVNEEHNEEEGVNDREAAEQLVEGRDDIEAGDHKDSLQGVKVHLLTQYVREHVKKNNLQNFAKMLKDGREG